ncbi:DEAD/DEAH box helicase [Desulfosediminicola flagellatus]|uniref:DEAD/DEAH box helicase n=1 Tax=Desulfosediminicola flagellatus TaxID=2569541 RepID=UPI0010ABF023|nr:DEAD/DEAH box helicase [Desulfosediminicola flagellatus]
MSFSKLGLSEPLLRAINEKGYTTPFPIQTKAIPAVLSGKDVMAAAQTGTGKTAGFTLPLLQRLSIGPRVRSNHIRALVLVPTRELAIQVTDAVTSYGKFLPTSSIAVYGGVKINPQMMQLRRGIDILVATPGRLLDLHRQNAVNFDQIQTLVLDEADKMLNLGFEDEIREILALLPAIRQNLLFSATFSSEIRTLTDKLLRRPVRIEVNPQNSAAKSVKQWLYEVDKSKKPDLLCHLLRNNDWQQVLVFCRTKKGADQIVRKLTGIGISALAIHGDKSQGARTHALTEFKAGAIRVLVATDIASRGIDISELSHVINLDLPKVAEDYIHRIGRTGRAGMEGVAISLVSADEVELLTAIETLIRHLLVREVATGYVPKHGVPLTQLQKPRPKKPKKPKKNTTNSQAKSPDDSRKPAGSREKSAQKSRRGSRSQTTGASQEKSGGRRNRKSSDASAPAKSCSLGSRKNRTNRKRR